MCCKLWRGWPIASTIREANRPQASALYLIDRHENSYQSFDLTFTKKAGDFYFFPQK